MEKSTDWVLITDKNPCFDYPDDDSVVEFFDCTDQVSYESPWNEADEDDLYARYAHGKVTCVLKKDDGMDWWDPEDQETAKVELFKSYKSFLIQEITRLQTELESLD